MHSILNFFFPHICVLCHNITDRHIDLCIHCEKELPFIQNSCHTCGIPLLGEIQICGNCLKKKPPLDFTFALFSYQEPITQMITQLKFNHQLAISKILGGLMADYLPDMQKPDCIIPIPLHPKRLKERGFNQALEIARPIVKKFNIPIDINSCKRIRYTSAQTSTPAKYRRKNIKNAFQVIKPIKAKYVVILDDVVTTGNTVFELSRILRRVGVEKIDVWCVARTS